VDGLSWTAAISTTSFGIREQAITRPESWNSFPFNKDISYKYVLNSDGIGQDYQVREDED
jgi:galactose mutarotase-like enzyme